MGKTVRTETHRFYNSFHDAFWDVDVMEFEIDVEDFHLPQTVFIEKLNATYRLKLLENRKVFIRIHNGT
jgi:hypothetical protein